MPAKAPLTRAQTAIEVTVDLDDIDSTLLTRYIADDPELVAGVLEHLSPAALGNARDSLFDLAFSDDFGKVENFILEHLHPLLSDPIHGPSAWARMCGAARAAGIKGA